MDQLKYEESELYRIRHSAAHLMAQALAELYPGIKLSIGPAIENGFYYDVESAETIREEDLARIEAKMKELAKLNQPISRRVAKDRGEARKIILEECTLGQGAEVAKYKLELLEAIPEGEEVSFYEQSREDKEGVRHYFIDLCRGPHVNFTSKIKHFKLMSIAGAYWRGDVKNIQLTRIYGTAFESAEALEKYLFNLEEAKRRDHRVLGKELGLFMFSQNVGVGLPLWLPRGTTLRETLVDFLRYEQVKRGYERVVTPHIANTKLFDKSGHTIAYKDGLFPFMESEHHETFCMKPMNCPFHMEIYKSQMRSYRDLPIRYAEFGTVYRYEQSGEVTGILRARGFTQDDAHLFVRPDQLLDEFIGTVEFAQTILKKLGLTDYRIRIGARDPENAKYVGSAENWELAESAIKTACERMKLDFTVSVGDAAFYGPKIDLMIRDALGREWQMGTVQVDYNLPERFELEYIGEDGKPHRPIMIHRAPFGSLERMIGLLTEHYAGAFPLWMAPIQVAVLPIADRHIPYANALAAKLQGFVPFGCELENNPVWNFSDVDLKEDLRIYIDDRRETLGKKIRENQGQKIPYMLVIGDRDVEAGTVGVRSREGGDLGCMSFGEFVDKVNLEV